MNCTINNQRVYNSAASVLWNALPEDQKVPFIKTFEKERILFKERGGRIARKPRPSIGFYDDRKILLTSPYKVNGHGNVDSVLCLVLHPDRIPRPQQPTRTRSHMVTLSEMEVLVHHLMTQTAFMLKVQFIIFHKVCLDNETLFSVSTTPNI